MNRILIRYGEISVKGQNRSFFINTLKNNIREKINGDLTLQKNAGRLYIESSIPKDQLISQLTKIPGIVSISPVKKIPSDLTSILRESLQAIKKKDIDKSTTFRVSTKRADKSYPMVSIKVNQVVGTHLLKNTKHLVVNLNNPELTLSIEIRVEGTFLYTEIIPGVGGLPVGTSGKALLLLSGGIDSPVAGWLALKRGVELESLYLHSPPFIGERSKKKVIDLCKTLLKYSPSIKLTILSLTPTLKLINKKISEKYSITIMRRIMMRMAETLAEKEKIPALITGESIGQVASQTLENLKSINSAIKIPVLRPLSGMDKMEIIALARKINTYRISVRPYEDCCTLFIPKHPILRPLVSDVEEMETMLPVQELINEAIGEKEVIFF